METWQTVLLIGGVVVVGVVVVNALASRPATAPLAPAPGDAASQERQTWVRELSSLGRAGIGLAGQLAQRDARSGDLSGSKAAIKSGQGAK